MKTNTLTTARKLQYLILVGLASVLALEAAARIVTPGPRWLNAHYVQMSGGLADLDELIADQQNTEPAPKYYDEFLYAPAPASTRHINFTDYYSARWTPDSVPLSEAEHVIWTFGGSTMENTETTDSLTIANTWAKIFNSTLGPTHVKNFGAGGFFSSYELIKFQRLLRDVPEHELPRMVIFYDGYNDALFGFQYGPGSLQKDLPLKLQALVEHQNVKLGTYALSRALSQYSTLWSRTGARLVESLLFTLPEPSTDPENLNGAVRVYIWNMRMIQATCDAFRIRCFFVLQPLIVTKEPLTRLEQEVLDGLEAHPRFGPEGSQFVRQFYERVIQEFADNQHFIDASAILHGRTESDFYDLGHTAAQTPPVIAEKIADILIARLDQTPLQHR